MTATDAGSGSTQDSARAAPEDASSPSAEASLAMDAGTCAAGLAVPEDPGARGPWPVGARTVQIDNLTVELWYPAVVGSADGRTPHRYDLREQLPASEAGKVSDADNPWQLCDCYRELPLDAAHGPFPVILFVHGTAGVRTQNLTQLTHWASRGYVVLAADHPSLKLADVSGVLGPVNLVLANPSGDLGRMLAALDAPVGELAFLRGALDMQRLGFSGQSRGGSEFQRYADRALVFVPLTSSMATSPQGGTLRSTLMMGGLEDTIGNYKDQQSNYDASPSAKRLIGVAKAGHVSFTDMCGLGRDRGGLLAIAKASGVQVGAFVEGLATDGCADTQIEPARMHSLLNYATAAAFDEVLHCDARMTAKLAGIKANFPEIAELREQLR